MSMAVPIPIPPRRAAKMLQQQHDVAFSVTPPPLPTPDEQERDAIMRDAERLDRQNDKCRAEISDVLQGLCKRGENGGGPA